MIHQQYITVAEAAILTHRSKSVIHRHIREGRLRAEETDRGARMKTMDVLEFFRDRRPGRPSRDTRKRAA